MESNDFHNELKLHVPHKNVKLSHCWTLGYNIGVFGTRKFGEVDEERPRSSFLLDVKWASIMHDSPFMRRLASESHKIFLMIQESSRRNPSTSQYLNFSCNYRAAMKSCCDELCNHLKSLEDEDEALQAKCEAEILNACEMLWHLCEIIFIQRSISMEPGSFVLNLLDWLYLHFPRATIWAEEAAEMDAPEEHPHYWDAIILFTLQGCSRYAVTLLLQHTAAKTTKCIVSLVEMIKTMPRSSFYSEQSPKAFEMRWQYWQSEVRARLETGEFAAIPDVALLAEILAGRNEAFNSERVRNLCQTWYHFMISKLFYQDPLADIGYALNAPCWESMRLYSAVTNDGSLAASIDSLTRLLFEMNVSLFIKEASESINLWWFVAHLMDLLQHVDPRIAQTFQGCDLRESFILEYAFGLMSHPAMWQITLSYLDYCSLFGRHHQRLFIERIHIGNERKAFMVINACEQRGLAEEAKSVCRCLARKELSRGRFSLALSWAVKARDCQLVSSLADHFLSSYTRSSVGAGGIDIITTLGRSALLSQKMAFLVRYREFHQLYSEGDHSAAADILVSLLSSRSIPKKYWKPLLIDATPLLEENRLTSTQICDLMHCLEESVQSGTSKADDALFDPDAEDIQLIQTTLTKAYSRSCIFEGSVQGIGVK